MCVYLVCIGEESHGLCQFSFALRKCAAGQMEKGEKLNRPRANRYTGPLLFHIHHHHNQPSRPRKRHLKIAVAVFFFSFHDCNFHRAWQCSSHHKKNDIVCLSRASKSLRNRVCVRKMRNRDQIKWISLIVSG